MNMTSKATNRHGWTREHRRRQARQIHRWKPWLHATGPKTLAGKQRVSQNALRTGEHSQELRAANALLRTAWTNADAGAN